MMNNKSIVTIFITSSILILNLLHGCFSIDDNTIDLKIFHAGSLSGPFMDLEAEFEKKNEDIDVQREAAGSVDAIRKITDLGKKGDILASADYSLIESMMIDNDPQYATWYIQFAVNRLVIAYTKDSTAKNELTSETWPEILSRSDVNFGFSNPNADPCGYRALMMLKLAELHYNLPDLFEELVEEHTSITIENVDENYTIKVPENLNPDSKVMIRPKEVDLMALLESGELDYLIIYRSVAYQHRDNGVEFIDLPDIIDLSNPDQAAYYDNVSLQQYSDLSGKGKLIQARPVVYGITIPTNAGHRNEAISFLKMLLGEIGRTIFNENGQPPIVPAKVFNIDEVPEELKEFVI
jgi:molybdate/tungstate transport system substrate-binding protein